VDLKETSRVITLRTKTLKPTEQKGSYTPNTTLEGTTAMSNKTTCITIGSILSIYYIRHNYMFRSFMLAIFRLYMNTYQVCNFVFQLDTQFLY